MTTLHILNKSPQHPFPASQCSQFYSKADAILLIEDAVYYTLPDAFVSFLKHYQTEPFIYALKEDIDARGISALAHPDIKVVTFDGFVELTAIHDKSTSWY
ncbi:sulfurtransferase complex subunit TusB [Alkalimarinus alittae]|uniref:Sulfurtransferase complex subunit TusB n=1 Tax=Alkalimarinus alittae TaxID=2961619 RepID=A0ABY6N727_9ALTE|nr:sulfurtransferase complex subunit TusB [Alkalimarinus alittae]UZE97896.1 sulfurtransferase complex subunit TusB [Alkalimarinus alittae]